MLCILYHINIQKTILFQVSVFIFFFLYLILTSKHGIKAMPFFVTRAVPIPRYQFLCLQIGQYWKLHHHQSLHVPEHYLKLLANFQILLIIKGTFNNVFGYSFFHLTCCLFLFLDLPTHYPTSCQNLFSQPF